MQNNMMDNSSDFIARVKAIPILDICQSLNIDVYKRGPKLWCKLRNERTASAVLNVHKYPNTYVDFGGSNKESDVIQFVAEATGTDRSEATKWLARTFNIVREKQNVFNSDLAHWEWAKLGLYGDLATKNFSFDIERQGFEEVAALSKKYGMPMNELRKQHPKMYEQLLIDHALPLIKSERNDYYVSLMNIHMTMKIKDFSRLPETRESFMKTIKELNEMEWLFRKACVKTSIKSTQIGEYDPDKDLQKILSGEIKPQLGNRSYDQMNAAATFQNTTVRYRPVPAEQYSFRALERFPHSAFFSGDKIVVGYLARDRKDVLKAIDKMVGKDRTKTELAYKIADAEYKQTLKETEQGSISRGAGKEHPPDQQSGYQSRHYDR